MKHFAKSFSDSSWKGQLGCLAAVIIPLLFYLAIIIAALYGAYTLGANG